MPSASCSLGLTVLLLLAVVWLDQVHGWGNRAQLNRRQGRQWPSSRNDVWQNDDDDGNDDDDDDNYGSSWKNRGSNARRMIQERRRQMKKYDNDDDDDDDDDDDYPQARGRQRISPTISRFHRLRNRYYRNRNQAARRHEEPDDDYWEDRARARRHGAVWGRQQQQQQQQGQQQGQQPGQQKQGQMNQYSDTQILSLYGRMKQYLSSRGLTS